MQIYHHFSVNNIALEPFPFARELSMAAYFVENQKVLRLDNDDFSTVEIIESELALKEGRQSKATDGRIDLLAAYSEEYIAVIELKIGCLNQGHLQQLEDYLSQKNQILELCSDVLPDGFCSSPRWIGILVGTSISPDLATKISNGYMTCKGKIPVAALTLQRFRGSDGNIFVITETYFKAPAAPKDMSKYEFEGHQLGKGRLVHAVIKKHVEKNPNITYAQLAANFPKICQGTSGVFSTYEYATEIFNSSGRRRHFLESDDLIKLSDSTIAVCNQWGIRNINNFINRANQLDFAIKPVTSHE